jgi:hypothetical protein
MTGHRQISSSASITVRPQKTRFIESRSRATVSRRRTNSISKQSVGPTADGPQPNIAPGYVHIFSATTVLTINPYYRLDTVKYFASPVRSRSTDDLWQSRRLNNFGVKPTFLM